MTIKNCPRIPDEAHFVFLKSLVLSELKSES